MYRNRLSDIVSDAVRSQEYWDLGGLSDSDGPAPLAALETALLAALADVRELRAHAHVWGENDYCSICGADGRA